MFAIPLDEALHFFLGEFRWAIFVKFAIRPLRIIGKRLISPFQERNPGRSPTGVEASTWS